MMSSSERFGLKRWRRRSFLGGAVAAATAVALENGPSPAGAAPAKVDSVRWPVGMRDAMLGPLKADNCWAGLKAVGAESVEVEINEQLELPRLPHPEGKYSLASAKEADRLTADARAAQVSVAALCMHNRFASRPEVEVQWTERVARAAAAIGCPVVRIDVVPEKLDRQTFLPQAADALKRIIEATAELPVRFGIENHGNTTNDPDFLDELFRRVDSPRLGLTLDTANFYWFGHPLGKLYAIYERFASRVFHTHCKSIAYPEELREQQRPMGYKYAEYHCPIDRGDIDFAKVIAILRRANYRGDLCIENESLGKKPADEAKTILAGEIALLKRLRGEAASSANANGD